MPAILKGEAAAVAKPVYHVEYGLHRRKAGDLVLRGEVDGKKFNLATINDDHTLTLRPGNTHPAFDADENGCIRVSG